MIRRRCDWCGKSTKEVGKLFRRGGMLLCKGCRKRLKERSHLKVLKKAGKRRFHR